MASPRAILLCHLALCMGAGALLVGCDVTPEKIERWKETEKGPGKLRDALKKSSLDPELRGHALAALVEVGMLGDAADDLKAVPEGERRPLVHAAVPRLVKLTQGTPGSSTTRVEREAKDALFVVRDWAPPEDVATIDETLVAWTTADLPGRMSAGAHTSEQILLAIGAKAGPRLAAIIADDTAPDGSRIAAATILGQVGEPTAREQAGAALVARARKTRNVPDALLRQIALVGGDHAVAFLTSVAEDTHQMATARQKALAALAQRPDPAALPAALRVAGDKKAPPEAREAAFLVAEKIGAPSVAGLLKLVDDKDDMVRWRAVEATLAAGKETAVGPLLEALPESRSYSREDLRSYVVHDLELIGPAARQPLVAELASKRAIARLAAVEALASIGKGEDADRVAALASDGTKVKGFDAAIGSEAKSAAEQLRSKSKK